MTKYLRPTMLRTELQYIKNMYKMRDPKIYKQNINVSDKYWNRIFNRKYLIHYLFNLLQS